MRERSPPLTKITHPSPPVWGIAGFNKAECNAESPSGGTACLITVSSVPGKLTAAATGLLLYSVCHERVVVSPRMNIIKRRANVRRYTAHASYLRFHSRPLFFNGNNLQRTINITALPKMNA